jgi:hypothetical protein
MVVYQSITLLTWDTSADVDKGLMMIQVYAKQTLSFRGNDLIGELESPVDIISVVGDRESYSGKVDHFEYLNAV